MSMIICEDLINTSKHGLNYHSNCAVLLLPSNGISTVGTVLEGFVKEAGSVV